MVKPVISAAMLGSCDAIVIFAIRQNMDYDNVGHCVWRKCVFGLMEFMVFRRGRPVVFCSARYFPHMRKQGDFLRGT